MTPTGETGERRRWPSAHLVLSTPCEDGGIPGPLSPGVCAFSLLGLAAQNRKLSVLKVSSLVWGQEALGPPCANLLGRAAGESPAAGSGPALKA